ncbi:hypothetical protein [Janthinobacterium sp. HH106]|uniref:hypothetical protein n=1 Tax=Janthinobacterium sp. HH106 TaxID=1537278 RepID=UPI0011131FE2|nr:hypothetical protein [Janthinobacterium sp. HH106]
MIVAAAVFACLSAPSAPGRTCRAARLHAAEDAAYHLGRYRMLAQIGRRHRPAQGVMKRHATLDELGHHFVRSDIVSMYIIDTVFHAMAPYRVNQPCIKF